MMIDQEIAREILTQCQTLKQAEVALRPLSGSRAIAWGLFDGWAGRSCMTSGLVHDLTPRGRAQRIEADYREAYEIGRKLALAEVPA